jgi:hypothetical protein
MAPWPPLERAYAAVFRAFGNAAFGLASGGDVRFVPHALARGARSDTDVFVRAGADGEVWGIPLSSRFVGWIPTAVLLALWAATPRPSRGRLRALGWGLALVHAYLVVRLALRLALAHALWARRTGGSSDFVRSAGWKSAVEGIVALLHTEPTIYVGLPVLAWAVASFRRSDLEQLVRPDPGP